MHRQINGHCAGSGFQGKFGPTMSSKRTLQVPYAKFVRFDAALGTQKYHAVTVAFGTYNEPTLEHAVDGLQNKIQSYVSHPCHSDLDWLSLTKRIVRISDLNLNSRINKFMLAQSDETLELLPRETLTIFVPSDV